MDYSRRKFLKGASVLASSMILPLQFASSNAKAAVSGGKKLVVLTLNGGNDGLNTIVPLARESAPAGVFDQYDLYAGYRPTIRIPKNSLLSLPFSSSTNNNTTGISFGLHPSLSALVTPENINSLAIFPATHSSLGNFSANTSHFYQMDLFARGLSGEAPTPLGPDVGKGWMGRYLDNRYEKNPGLSGSDIIAQDFAAGLHGNFNGNLFTLDLSNPATLGLGTSESVADAIRSDTKYISEADESSSAGKYKNVQSVLFDQILNNLKSNVDFGRATSATYPLNNKNLVLGSKFKQVADMLVDLPELEIVHLSQGGYDTHQNQVVRGNTVTGNQAGLLKNWSESIAAFYEDLRAVDANTGSALSTEVVVVVQTEFGRTIEENKDLGTDHGHASCWMAFGDSVQGGIYGGYEGLEQNSLNNSGNAVSKHWLRPTIDYRDIYARILGTHLGSIDPASAFPGNYNYNANTLNFLA